MNSVEWGILIALDFFFGGIAIGSFLFSVIYKKMKNADNNVVNLAAYISPICLIVAMFFLLIHLGKPLRIFWILLNFNFTSIIAWGALAQGVFLVVSILYALMVYSDSKEFEHRESSKVLEIIGTIAIKLQGNKLKDKIGGVGIVFAVIVGLYQGILLLSFNARPLWNSEFIPIIQLSGAFTCGLSTILLSSKFFIKETISDHLINSIRNIIVAVLIFEFITLIFWILSYLSGNIENQTAILKLIYSKGILFWIFAVIIGFCIPIYIGLRDIANTKKESVVEYTTPILFNTSVLIGCLILRYTTIAAG